MYTTVFVGGTFDGLHRGHEVLLERAFDKGEKVVIGVTSDAFIYKYKSQITNPNDQSKNKLQISNSIIRSYNDRRLAIEEWLQKKKLDSRATVISIDSPHEPAASNPAYAAIVATDETKHRVDEINIMRKSRGLKVLSLLLVPILPAEDGQPISSTRVRKGVIDLTGRLVMPEFMRTTLGEPLGTVLSGGRITSSLQKYQGKTIISVGDMTTKTLLDAGIRPLLSIIDGKVGRQPFSGALDKGNALGWERKEMQSGPGFIAQEAADFIQRVLASQNRDQPYFCLFIRGEEDLLTLPAIIHASVGSVVYYGQPAIASVRGKPEGVVEVVVTDMMKNKAQELMDQFSET